MAWLNLADGLLRLPALLAAGRLSYTFDGIPMNARRLPWKKRANLVRAGMDAMLNRPVMSGPPPTVQVEPCNVCNLQCPLCPTGSDTMKRPRGMMSMETFQKILDELGDVLVTMILYCWGEPFLNKDLPRMIEAATQRGILTATSTNGHCLQTMDEALQVVDAGLTGLVVAIDGSTQDIYGVYRKSGSVDKVKRCAELIEKAKALRGAALPYTDLRVVVTRYNEGDIENLERLARQLGLQHVLLQDTRLPDLEAGLRRLRGGRGSLAAFDNRGGGGPRAVQLPLAPADHLLGRHGGGLRVRLQPGGAVRQVGRATVHGAVEQPARGVPAPQDTPGAAAAGLLRPLPLHLPRPARHRAGVQGTPVCRGSRGGHGGRALMGLQRWMTRAKVLAGIAHGGRAFGGPYQAALWLTNRCNLQCIHCYFYSPLLPEPNYFEVRAARGGFGPEPDPDEVRTRRTRDADAQATRTVIDDLVRMGTRSFHVAGSGEPMLHPEAMEFFARIKRAGGWCCMNTNGTLLDRERVEALVGMGFNELRVTTMAGTEEVYARTHPGSPPGTFGRIRDGLLALAERKASAGQAAPRLNLICIVVQQNCDALDEFVRFAARGQGGRRADQPRRRHRGPGHGAAGADGGAGGGRAGAVPELARFLEERGIRHNLERFAMTFRSRLDTRALYHTIPCYMGWLSLRVSAEGNVYPCCRCYKPMGNVREDGIGAIWHGDAYNAFRRTAGRLNRRGSPVEGCACYDCSNSAPEPAHVPPAAPRLAAGCGRCGGSAPSSNGTRSDAMSVRQRLAQAGVLAGIANGSRALRRALPGQPLPEQPLQPALHPLLLLLAPAAAAQLLRRARRRAAGTPPCLPRDEVQRATARGRRRASARARHHRRPDGHGHLALPLLRQRGAAAAPAGRGTRWPASSAPAASAWSTPTARLIDAEMADAFVPMGLDELRVTTMAGTAEALRAHAPGLPAPAPSRRSGAPARARGAQGAPPARDGRW